MSVIVGSVFMALEIARIERNNLSSHALAILTTLFDVQRGDRVQRIFCPRDGAYVLTLKIASHPSDIVGRLHVTLRYSGE